jgi:RHS repeat-associated protein
MEAPVAASRTTITPSSLTNTVVETRSATLADATNPLSATTLTDTIAVNGRAFTRTYDAVAQTRTTQTPAGRTTVEVLDDKGRVLEVRPPGHSTGAVLPIQFAYDVNGRLYGSTQGTRTFTFGYDALGYQATITDPLQRTTRAWYDPVGRVVDQELLGGRHVTFGYDGSGNLTSLTPPERPAHGFGYTPVDRVESYTPPTVLSAGSVSTGYTYNLAGDLSLTSLPDGTAISPAYDDAGRLAFMTTARGTTFVGYDGQGRVGTVTAPDGGQVSFSYDGFLKTGETWTGVVAGNIGYSYDNDFRVAAVSVNGNPVSYLYDPDGLVTQAGTVTIARDLATGQISGTTTGLVTTSQYHNEYGELRIFTATANGVGVYSYTLDRDNAGRIIGKEETIDGTSTTYVYEYDAAGRLWRVTRNGIVTAEYTYDANGNRLTGPQAESGTYDDQDRMLSYGGATFTYGANGDLRTKTENGQVTSYWYDALGNLTAATLPDGTQIEYLIDGLNRRVGKTVNGALVEGFLYDGQLRPAAWLDGTGNVYARFVYGTRVNVPEYVVTAAGTFRILTDHLGSPRLVVSTSTGEVMQRVDYDERGVVVADTNPGFQPFGFAGGLYDRHTGLVRFGARDYDPSTGRWTNKDPIRFRGGLNVYEYLRSDPLNGVDPYGLYGTTSCEPYGARCSENGHPYYCYIAPDICNSAPKGQPWSDCARKCLQDYDAERDTNVCEDKSNPYTDFDPSFEFDLQWEHYFCFYECAKDSDANPHTRQSQPND